jgi:hypothetical protein
MILTAFASAFSLGAKAVPFFVGPYSLVLASSHYEWDECSFINLAITRAIRESVVQAMT